MWIDNFSKHSRWQLPHLDEGVYKSCLWTGFAVNKFRDDGLSMALKRTPSGNAIPAMPDSPFLYLTMFKDAWAAFEESSGMLNYNNSRVVRWKVRNVPLGPLKKNVPRKYHGALDRKPGSLHGLYPEKLVDLNVGANDDFGKLFKNLLDEHNKTGPDGKAEKYLVLNLDCNIYDRVMKVSNDDDVIPININPFSSLFSVGL